MAQGARERLGGDWALSVSGIAGPSGAVPNKPVGTVFIGMAGPADEVRWLRAHLPSDRDRVRWMSTQLALDWLRRRLSGLPLPLAWVEETDALSAAEAGNLESEGTE